MKLYTAEWCAPCKALKKRLFGLGCVPDELEIVDIDESPDKATGIRAVPCLVDGDVVIANSDKIYNYLKEKCVV